MNRQGLLSRGVAVGAIGALTIAVSGVGIATAANGGSLILGHNNTATKTTTLTDASGTPLSLAGKASKPPLRVNSRVQVAHLNASLLGGLSASGLATSGSAASLDPESDIPLSTDGTHATKLVATATLAPGTYFVSASAETFDSNATTENGVICFVAGSPDIGGALGENASDSHGRQAESETVAVKLLTATKLGEYCYSSNGDNVDADGGGIYAIKLAHVANGTTGP